MLFQPFKKATRPETPGFAAATAAEGKMDQRAAEYDNAQKQQALLGGMNVYNEGMGPDNNPIYDSLFGVEEVSAGGDALAGIETLGGPAGTTGMAPGVPGAAVGAEAALATEAAMPAMLSGGAGGTAAAGAMAPAAIAPVAAGAAVPPAAATPALAGMGPAGWAAMAALALGLLG